MAQTTSRPLLTGAAVRRREDPSLLAGAGHYVDDLAPTGTLHLAFIRAPYAHARLNGVDTTAAAALPGVVRVVTAADLTDLRDLPTNRVAQGMQVPPHPPLARDTVNFVGDPVAVVVAESRTVAYDAAALVEVDYEPLEAVVDAAAALAPNTPLARVGMESNVCYRLTRAGGDVDRAFTEADHVVSVRLSNPRVAAVAIEPRGVLAVPEGLGDGVTVYLSTQAPFTARENLAIILGLPESRVRVIAPEVGGGFGSKGSLYREDAIATYLAVTLNRPVKWVATRSEDLATTMQGRGMDLEASLALKRDGTMTGLKVRVLANLGAYLHNGTPGPPTRLLAMSAGCYQIRNVAIEVLGVLTNEAPTGPYRGAGRPEAVLLIERLASQAAHDLGLDPVALRRQNFIQADQFPYATATGVTYDSGDYVRSLDRALELADYPALVRERDAARARGDLVGIGLTTFVEPSGGGGYESGVVRFERTGQVSVITSSSSHGQGHHTVFAQVVADQLGVPMERILVRHGDTFASPQGIGTFGSRSATIGGMALVQASQRVVEKARRIAAHLLEAAPEDVVQQADGFVVAGAPSKVITWGDVATAAYRTLNLPPDVEPGLEATAFFKPPQELYGFGAHLAYVRVERETGRVEILRYVGVDDCGNLLNPLLVEGQVVGGFAQGLGQALTEQVVYDESGQLVTGTLGDYAVPRATDIPPLTLGHTITPTPLNPLGIKGVGESGTIAATPTLLDAVLDALWPLGVRDLPLPLTAQRVWFAIQAARGPNERE